MQTQISYLAPKYLSLSFNDNDFLILSSSVRSGYDDSMPLWVTLTRMTGTSPIAYLVAAQPHSTATIV